MDFKHCKCRRIPHHSNGTLRFAQPNMDGLQLLEAVRERGLAVVMMSAYGTTETTEAALGLGAVDTISKPFRPTEISCA